MDQFQQTFVNEAHDLLENLEEGLLALEESPDDMETIGAIFRALHTLKGSGAMFGFNNISRFAHEIENIYDLMRSGGLTANQEIISATLAAKDVIRGMLAQGDEVSDETGQEMRRIQAVFAPFSQKKAGKSVDSASQKPPVAAEAEASEEEKTWRIRFRPSSAILRSGLDPSTLFAELKDMGVLSITANVDNIPYLSDITPDETYVLWDMVLTTQKDINAIKDVFIFVEDDSEIRIEEVELEDERPKRLGDILVERGDASPEAIDSAFTPPPKIGEVLVEKGVVSPGYVASAIAEQKHLKDVQEKKKQLEETSSIKVDTEKLDRLVNLIGELVTSQARLSQIAQSRADMDVVAVSEELERLTADLRDNAMSIRMLPIGTLFTKFRRLVRDLSKEMKKEIKLVMEGAETELDKTVIDKLNDPMVHLIRNSLDHGIETPEKRLAAGKPAEGLLRLTARHEGANVIIEIVDDGRGIDKDAVLNKAMEKGLVGPGVNLTDAEIYKLILLPGFSTAKTVSSVSGRGVGMDVVKKNIDSLRGSIEIASRPGEGTTVSLKIPLTLAIIDGLLTRIENEHFIIPLAFVEECIELTQDRARQCGGDFVEVRGELVPYLDLRRNFAIEGDPPEIRQAVIVSDKEQRLGLIVDTVLGDHQTVIKPLGSVFKNVDFLSGASILGNGEIALIVDVVRLSETFRG